MEDAGGVCQQLIHHLALADELLVILLLLQGAHRAAQASDETTSGSVSRLVRVRAIAVFFIMGLLWGAGRDAVARPLNAFPIKQMLGLLPTLLPSR